MKMSQLSNEILTYSKNKLLKTYSSGNINFYHTLKMIFINIQLRKFMYLMNLIYNVVFANE